MTIDVNDFLDHHGVKGMRWGVRRKDESDESSSSFIRKLLPKLKLNTSYTVTVRSNSKTLAYKSHSFSKNFLDKNGDKSINDLRR